MELGLTIPLQKHLKVKTIPYGEESNRHFCWDLHVISLQGRSSLLAVHCCTRYAFTLFDLNRLEWDNLSKTFLTGLRQSLHRTGVPEKTIDRYLQQAGAIHLTKTHGRREVAYLNRAWEDVLAFDYTLDPLAQSQPLLDHAVNTTLCRCARMDGLGPAEERIIKCLQKET